MEIHIIKENGTAEIIRLRVNLSDTIEVVKAKIKEEINIPILKQKLTFAHRVLDNDRTLFDCGIRNESCIRLSAQVFIFS